MSTLLLSALRAYRIRNQVTASTGDIRQMIVQGIAKMSMIGAISTR